MAGLYELIQRLRPLKISQWEEAKESLKRLKEQGNDAKEEHKGEEDANINDAKNINVTNGIENEQTQISSSTNSNDEHVNKLIGDKIKEQARKDEEIKQLKEELAKLRAEFNRNTGNDLNYNSSYGDNDHTENNDINYDVVPGTLKRRMN